MKKFTAILMALIITFCYCITASASTTSIDTAVFTQDIKVDIVDANTGKAWNPIELGYVLNYVDLDMDENVLISVDPDARIERAWYNAGAIHVILSFVGNNREFIMMDNTGLFINGNPAVLEKEGDQIYQIGINLFPAPIMPLLELFCQMLNVILHMKMMLP